MHRRMKTPKTGKHRSGRDTYYYYYYDDDDDDNYYYYYFFFFYCVICHVLSSHSCGVGGLSRRLLKKHLI